MHSVLARACQSAAVVFIFAASAAAHDYSAGPLEVTDAWTRATPTGATTAVGFLKLSNRGAKPVTLTGAETTAAEHVEVHQMTIDNGVMRMRPMKAADIAPGATIEFKPGGMHLMLIGLKKSLSAGEMIPLTLLFADGARLSLELHVEAMGAGHGAHEH